MAAAAAALAIGVGACRCHGMLIYLTLRKAPFEPVLGGDWPRPLTTEARRQPASGRCVRGAGAVTEAGRPGRWAALTSGGMAVAEGDGMRSIITALAVVTVAVPARAGVDLVLSGPAQAVVAAGDRVAVVQDGQIRLLAADGRVLRRLGAAPSSDGRRPVAAERRADEVLEL